MERFIFLKDAGISSRQIGTPSCDAQTEDIDIICLALLVRRTLRVRIPATANKKVDRLVDCFVWRRERDSNPRGRLLPPNDLANRPLKPLGYLSVTHAIITD